jgi:hypothetical protein
VGVGGSDPSKVGELATSHDHVTILFTGEAWSGWCSPMVFNGEATACGMQARTVRGVHIHRFGSGARVLP